ncbi:MAG: hypothetical protein AAF581_04570 [Planctomycetota bacterium]
MIRRLVLLLILLVTTFMTSGCALQRMPKSHQWNPLGWPATGLHAVGVAGANSEWPILRETGRLFTSVGTLLDTPAQLIESAVMLDPPRLADAGETFVVGTGSTVTSIWNLPWFWLPGSTMDLAKDAELINAALAELEQVPREKWQQDENDPRPWVFPPGTRVEPAGRSLVYTIPGHGELLQVAESNRLWDGVQKLLGMHFSAQERSWGFITRSAKQWEQMPKRARAKTTLHELYHQHQQMRETWWGWTSLYWPAYNVTFLFTGWDGHWAETKGYGDASAVDRGLKGWKGTL